MCSGGSESFHAIFDGRLLSDAALMCTHFNLLEWANFFFAQHYTRGLEVEREVLDAFVAARYCKLIEGKSFHVVEQ